MNIKTRSAIFGFILCMTLMTILILVRPFHHSHPGECPPAFPSDEAEIFDRVGCAEERIIEMYSDVGRLPTRDEALNLWLSCSIARSDRAARVWMFGYVRISDSCFVLLYLNDSDDWYKRVTDIAQTVHSHLAFLQCLPRLAPYSWHVRSNLRRARNGNPVFGWNKEWEAYSPSMRALYQDDRLREIDDLIGFGEILLITDCEFVGLESNDAEEIPGAGVGTSLYIHAKGFIPAICDDVSADD